MSSSSLAAGTPTLHIDAFDWGSIKQRFFVLGEIQDALRIFLKVQQDLLFRGRKVLVIVSGQAQAQQLPQGQQGQRPLDKLKLLQQQQWDLILRIRGNMDYSILGAYLQNIPKPISVLWIGGDIPPVMLNKYDTNIHWVCYSGSLPIGREMNYVFISPSLPVFKYKDWLLSQVAQAQAHGVLASIEELRAKKAGMVVSTSDHSIKWYDSASLEDGNSDELTIKDLRDILIWCTEQMGYLDT